MGYGMVRLGKVWYGKVRFGVVGYGEVWQVRCGNVYLEVKDGHSYL